MTDTKLVCSICVYIAPPSEPDETELTMINGQLVCIDHAGYAQGEPWSTMHAVARRDHDQGIW